MSGGGELVCTKQQLRPTMNGLIEIAGLTMWESTFVRRDGCKLKLHELAIPSYFFVKCLPAESGANCVFVAPGLAANFVQGAIGVQWHVYGRFVREVIWINLLVAC